VTAWRGGPLGASGLLLALAGAAAAQARPADPTAPVRADLAALATAQSNQFATTTAFATTLAPLITAGYFVGSPEVTVSLLSVSREGWSAVASRTDDPSVRCVGIGAAGASQPIITCQGMPERVPAGSGAAPPAGTPAAAPDSAPAPDSGPAVIECTEPSPQPGLVEGFVLLSFVVDEDGIVLPNNIRVLQSPGIQNSLWAIAAVASCRYKPAIANGQPVLATVTRRVRYSPPPRP